MNKIGLSLNEGKTSLKNARREKFDFLGYTFGPLYSPRTGGRYNGATPSKKSVNRLKESVRQQLQPSNMRPLDDVVTRLNRTLRGWANYFDYGTVTTARHQMDRFVYEKVRHFLRRRHKVQGRGVRRFPERWVFGEMGVLSLCQLRQKGRMP